MKLKTLFTAGAVATLFSASVAWASMTIRYYNEDSQDYAWDATCSGSKYKVKFDKSKTSSVSIQGSTPCTIHTGNGDVTFKGDAKIRIKNGKITVE
ncbi:MAG: hypothetical protein ACTHU0_07335 [Kofleriaceae bacterium]